MISFVVITDTPARVRDFLVARGVIKETETGSGIYTGVRHGMEWVEVPNPIVTNPGPPPVYDTRAVFLVKFAWESESEKAQAFIDWVIANSSVQSAPDGWTINGQPAGSARKITGEQVWLAHVNPDRFGVWQ
jgi:hypothetical protein